MKDYVGDFLFIIWCFLQKDFGQILFLFHRWDSLAQWCHVISKSTTYKTELELKPKFDAKMSQKLSIPESTVTQKEERRLTLKQ